MEHTISTSQIETQRIQIPINVKDGEEFPVMIRGNITRIACPPGYQGSVVEIQSRLEPITPVIRTNPILTPKSIPKSHIVILAGSIFFGFVTLVVLLVCMLSPFNLQYPSNTCFVENQSGTTITELNFLLFDGVSTQFSLCRNSLGDACLTWQDVNRLAHRAGQCPNQDFVRTWVTMQVLIPVASGFVFFGVLFQISASNVTARTNYYQFYRHFANSSILMFCVFILLLASVIEYSDSCTIQASTWKHMYNYLFLNPSASKLIQVTNDPVNCHVELDITGGGSLLIMSVILTFFMWFTSIIVCSNGDVYEPPPHSTLYALSGETRPVVIVA